MSSERVADDVDLESTTPAMELADDFDESHDISNEEDESENMTELSESESDDEDELHVQARIAPLMLDDDVPINVAYPPSRRPDYAIHSFGKNEVSTSKLHHVKHSPALLKLGVRPTYDRANRALRFLAARKMDPSRKISLTFDSLELEEGGFDMKQFVQKRAESPSRRQIRDIVCEMSQLI